MKNLLRILPLLLILIAACRTADKNIFYISSPDGHINDLLDMAESTNVPEISSDSLLYYLTKAEIFAAEKLTFKNFGTIHKNERFSVVILLEEGSAPGRDYTFIVRTFDRDFNIIDSYKLASWIDDDNRYCYGYIDPALMINRSCEDGEDIRQIMPDGTIVAAPFQVKE